MQARYGDFTAAGAEVLVVAQGRPESVAMVLAQQPVPFPTVADPSREGYRAFGLERTSWWAFFRPDVLAWYLWLMARGWWLRRPDRGVDLLQLGGDFVLDREGRVSFAHRSATAIDRPPVDRLLEAVREGR